MLTYQQMFDRAFIGLRSQNFVPSYTSTDGCLYNGPNNTHCAWGWVVKDTGVNVYEGGSASANPCGLLITSEDNTFANDLQAAHDYAAHPAVRHSWLKKPVGQKYNYKYQEMESNLRKFAAYHGLTVPE